MLTLDNVKKIAAEMVRKDQARDTMFSSMDAMWHNEWTRPASLQNLDWISDHIDPAPHNAVQAGIRAYANNAPSAHMLRPGNTTLDKERFDQIEAQLQYQYTLASTRMGGTLTEEIFKSALLYDMVVLQVVHVDAQLSLVGDISDNRRRAIKYDGDFVVNVHNPQAVHVRQSGFMTEAVLLKKVQSVAEFEAFWGDKAKNVLSHKDDKDSKDDQYVCVYDYSDYDDRIVWANLQATNTTYSSATDGWLVMKEAVTTPFLPWVAVSGASLLESNPAYQFHPLLYTVYKTDAWNNKNIKDTLIASEVISHAAAPRYKFTSATGEFEMGYGDPARMAGLKPNELLEVLNPPPMDENLLVLADRDAERIRQSTAPDVVVSLSSGSQEAGYTFNQRLQSGLQSFVPYKRLSELALGKAFCHMLYWAKFLNKPISGPSYDKKSKTYAFAAEPIVIDPTTYEYDQKVAVELKPDTPIDRQAQAQTAQLLKNIGWADEKIAEMMGEDNPTEVFEQAAREALRNQKLMNRLKIMDAEGTMDAQVITAGQGAILELAKTPEGAQALQQLAQQLAQAQAAPQQQQQALPQGQGTPPNPENATGIEGVEGEGFNTGAGAGSALAMNPNATKEGQTNRTRRGTPTS